MHSEPISGQPSVPNAPPDPPPSLKNMYDHGSSPRSSTPDSVGQLPMRGPPPATRSGTACASAFITASCIAPDGATTELEVDAGCSARQIVPGRAITVMRSIEPWLCGISGLATHISGTPLAAVAVA
jgi:hypothetical protein